MSNSGLARVAVVGAGGLLGSDLIRVAPKSFRILPYHRDTDIRNASLIKDVFHRDRPDWIINTASLSDVDECERSPDKAYELNVKAIENLSSICRSMNIPLIHVSTDYVFAGRDAAYREDDKTTPINMYGKTKLEGEHAAALWEKHYVIRTSSLYGTARANHATRIMESLKEKKKIKLAEDMVGSPTYVGDLAQWIYTIVEKKPSFGVYHLCNSGYCSRFEFAEKLAREAGHQPPYPFDPIRISSLLLPAKRAENLKLSLKKWETAMGPLPTIEQGISHFLRISQAISV